MFLTSIFSTAVTAFKWRMLCVPRDFCHLHTTEPSSVLSTSLRGRFLQCKGRKRETTSPSLRYNIEASPFSFFSLSVSLSLLGPVRGVSLTDCGLKMAEGAVLNFCYLLLSPVVKKLRNATTVSLKV